MSKHTPIYFRGNYFSIEDKNRLKKFTEKHPVASSIGKAILAAAIMGGVLTLAVVAPGIVNIANKIGKNKNNSEERKERYRKLWRRFNDMKKQNIFEVEKENQDGSITYRLTNKGKIITKKFLLDTLEIEAQKNWDQKWRVVIFDIPEKYKKARKELQSKLREMGFEKLQKSVWVHPFPCEAEIMFLNDIFNTHSFVEIFTTSDLKNKRMFYCFQHLYCYFHF
jgi:virulence-associated protein VapD